MQLCVLRLGFLQDRNVGISVFPEGEESIASDFEQASLRAAVSDWCYSTFGFSYTGHTTGFVFSKSE